MSFLGSPEVKVGLLVIVVSTLIGAMSLKVSQGPGYFASGNRYSFVVDDAGGLIKNSHVRMAGIRVGVIEDIVLENGRARVHLLLERNVELTRSARVELRPQGILGDKYVELVPGSLQDPVMPSGDVISETNDSMGIDHVLSKVGEISDTLNELMTTLNKAASGDGNDSSPIGRIVLNIEKISADLAEVTDQNKEKINHILSRIQSISENIDNYINQESLARLDQSLRNIEEITDKLNRGEGTLGRLINDEETVEEINAAIANVNKFLGGADKMETSIDFHSEYLTNVDLTKSYLGIKIQPGLDRYYKIQIIDDPKGVVTTTQTDSSLNGGPTQSELKTQTFHNKVKFSALFAKNFYDFTVKGGIIENSGGVGFDYHLFGGKVRLSTEFFRFDDVYARAFVRYNFFKGVYVIGGGDNLFSSNEEPYSTFVGAGIFITNDDLKLLASRLSF